MIEKSVYDFTTLKEAVDYFNELGFTPDKVEILGEWGGTAPMQDDSAIFYVD